MSTVMQMTMALWELVKVSSLMKLVLMYQLNVKSKL